MNFDCVDTVNVVN